MLIVHENMFEEASVIAEVVNNTYGIESSIKSIDLRDVFIPIPEFDGYLIFINEVELALRKFLAEIGSGIEKAVFVLTPRDLFLEKGSRDDDWVFGYNSGKNSVVSVARLKREDNRPSDTLQVHKDLYRARLKLLGVHEIGHDIVKGKHMQSATCVNAKTGYESSLGAHCTDNTCVMYEVIDIKTPKSNEGYMVLGTEKRFDAGLDDLILGLRADYLCSDCGNSVKIDESYR